MVLFDNSGYLLDVDQWTKIMATQIAQQLEIEITAEHWEIIQLARQYYKQYNSSPMNKALVNYTAEKLGANKGNSIYLMKLFTAHPAKVVAKISGLPKPHNCL